MGTSTFLWILLIAIIAIAFAVFQYGIGKSKAPQRALIYAILRFLSVFGLLLLLVNPKWTQITYTTEKPSLTIAVDNSKSIKHLVYDSLVRDVVERFRESDLLKEKFNLQFFKFGKNTELLDSLNFKSNQTNIAQVFTTLQPLNKKGPAPTVLVTDGNQTFGRDYKYAASNFKNPVYPVIVGDTTRYVDFSIDQINVNRYAYINNKFPVELFLKYSGSNEDQVSTLTIRSGNTIVHKETVRFYKDNTTVVRTPLLQANTVGLSRYSASIAPLNSEKNTENNFRNFAIEVIDQKTNVLLISNVVHPDVGMFKKSIQSNTLRDVTIRNTKESIGKINEFQLVLLYQPNEQFSEVFKEINTLNKNYIVVTGSQTNWTVLNQFQENVEGEVTGQTQDSQGNLNVSFSSFSIPDIGFSEFPPLLGSFGDITFKSEVDVAFFQKIGTINTSQPLIAASDLNGQRSIYILGEGIWKWRSQSYRDSKGFQDFDNFIDKLVQYTASNKRKNRLELSYDSFYYGNSDVKISAQYFDKNYVFDGRASINATILNTRSKSEYKAPFIVKGNYYELDISNLEAGEYTFTATLEDQGLSRSGTFTIIPFEAELQFLNANASSLQEVADLTEGTSYLLREIENLTNNLLKDDRYKPVQKSNEKVVPLIDRTWLLALVIFFLTIEWFSRKYHGLV